MVPNQIICWISLVFTRLILPSIIRLACSFVQGRVTRKVLELMQAEKVPNGVPRETLHMCMEIIDAQRNFKVHKFGTASTDIQTSTLSLIDPPD